MPSTAQKLVIALGALSALFALSACGGPATIEYPAKPANAASSSQVEPRVEAVLRSDIGTYTQVVIPKEVAGTASDLKCIEAAHGAGKYSTGGISCDWESAKLPAAPATLQIK